MNSCRARYVYDAWGNILSKSGRIAEINPFRYRGYYYDDETGFYYLQTRYYDPTIMRFINADNYELVASLSVVPGQLNLYAYANNNPITYTDETGEGLLMAMLLGAIFGGVLSAGIDVISQGVQNNWENINISQVGLTFLSGALSGAFAGSSLGIGWQIGANVGINMLLNVATQVEMNERIDVYEFAMSGIGGVFSGIIGGSGVYYIKTNNIKEFMITLSNKDIINKLFSAISKSLAFNIFANSNLGVWG